MSYKNINTTTENETLIPIWYIESYKNPKIRDIFDQYKFKNRFNSEYLLNICVDICVNNILENNHHYIIFTYPPSTMFYRKEKNADSMGDLITQTKKYINFYFRKDIENYSFKKIFSINKKYLKHKKAQHLDSTRKNRIKNLYNRYYINFWNQIYLKKLCKNSKVIVYIIDDISSTGGTLLACRDSLSRVMRADDDIEIELYSLAH